jgi:SNF2 family DNA or RNA helicase
LLLHEPGMGKTLICIAFCLKQIVESDCELDPILIVCPAQLLPVWARELDSKLIPGHISHMSLIDLQKLYKRTGVQPPFPLPTGVHVFIVSYSALVVDRKKLAPLLMKQHWSHVFFDEAHNMKNQKAKAFHAGMCLIARYKWVVTATPVMNKLDELHSYLRLIRLPPYTTKWMWQKDVVELAEQNAKAAFDKVEDILGEHALRMKKCQLVASDALPTLHPKQVLTIEVVPTATELAVFEEVRAYCQTRVNILRKLFHKHRGGGARFLANGRPNPVAEKEFQIRNILRMHMIAMITKLRRAACHVLLVLPYFQKLPPASRKLRDLSLLRAELATNFKSFQHRFSECSLCMDAWAEYRLSPCHHCVCAKCLERMQKSQVVLPCLRCDQTFAHVEQLPGGWKPQELEQEAWTHMPEFESQQLLSVRSSKLERLVSLLLDPAHAGRKWLIVSEWTTVLRLIRAYIGTSSPELLPKFVLMDGSSTVKKRAAMIDDFQRADSQLQFALLSLTAMGVGVTLTAATRVLFFEPYWNVTIEQQAMDRCHRIGQRDDVVVYHFLLRGTVERLMFQMKEHKAMISDAVAGNQAFPNAKAHWVNNVKLFMESQVQQPVQSTLTSWISTQRADSASSTEDEKKPSSSEEEEAEVYEIDLSLV